MDDASVFLLSTSESEGGKDCADEKIKDEFLFTEEEGPVNILSPHRSTFCAMSMDEVLFGDSKNRHVAALLESPARCVAKHSSCSSSYSSSLSSSPSRSVCNDNVAMREGDEAVPDVPRSMLELRGMTCADVRGVLEPFFRRKEEARRQFDAARERLAAMMATTTTTITAGSVSKVNKKMLDRWRRLVNISNWGDGTSSSNNNNNDVLFPDVLVPPVTSLLGGSNTPTTASSNTMLVPSSELRYLRPHQLDGIRFLWSILVEGPCGKVPAVGCILAHTMGLGKTCQVVVFLHLFLGDQRRRGRGRGRPQRVLIAVPKSTRSGWCKEFSTWSQYFPLADRITPIVIDERDNARRRAEVYREWRKAGGVLLLGYEMLLGLTRVSDMENKRDNKEESSTEWIDLLICDEAHRLKSTHLQISTALRGLHPLRRLLLTGTPLQNHLQEYWAMVDFAVHKYFEKKRFQEFFINPIEASVAKEASSKEVAAARMKTFALIRELRHFVQRVDSTPLQKELPPLHEYVVVVPLSALQTRLYNRFLCLLRREHSKFNFLQAVSYANKISSHPQLLFDTDPTSPVRGILNNVDSEWDETTTTTTTNNNNNNNNSVVDEEEEEQMQKTNREKTARQQQRTKSSATVNGVYAELCQTPAGYTATPEDGAKLYISIKIIKAAMLRGEKVLFFSLSTKLLDLFEGIIAEMNRRWKQDGSLPRSIRFCRLDGSNTSAEREDTLRSFKGNKGADVLLLSMKAGGVGITITSATRVILADSGFNPADDRQAIGRAYRYGQTRPVFVYRLVCYQTLEHRMFQQKVAKEWLFRTIVEEASLKRDALSGLRLQSMFQLLGRARKVSSGVLPTLTDEQQDSTARLVAEDTVLADVAEDILYAESHAVYLQHDEFVQYGNEEKLFYEEYQKKGIFNVDKNIDTSAADMERWKRRREKHQENVEEQTKTLTALVDDIIRSRADDDPKLRHLLRMMGVIVDASGVVSVAASSAQEAEKEAKELHSVVVDDDYESDDDDDERHSRLHGEKAPRTEAWPALRPVKIDDDDDESILFDKAKSDGGSLVLVDPSKYEPYRPGRDSHCAILIDEDDDL